MKKPSKPDYSQPKAYRIISLLNCLGKISERIIAKRLGYLAKVSNLLDSSQIGGRLKKSAIDAALLLTNEVEVNRQKGLKTSTLFLDVKCAFDHVSRNRLLQILQKQKLPTSLILWVSSFLSKRRIRLAFDGQLESFRDIETGIPQGSPISPILFLIYIRELFKSKAVKIISYIDDIAIITASTSLKKNIRILEREVTIIHTSGEENAVAFDLTKTELMHFTGRKTVEQGTQQHIITLPNGDTVQPSGLIRWLGIWFDPKLSFRNHIQMRVAQATQSFHRMARLANTGRGLGPAAMR